MMYHQLVSQKSQLKVEYQLGTKRIIKKDEQIAILQKDMKQAKTEVMDLRREISDLQSSKESDGRGSSRYGKNIRKKIKGGRGRLDSRTHYSTMIVGGPMDSIKEEFKN